MKKLKVFIILFAMLMGGFGYSHTAKADSGSAKVSGGGTYEVGDTVKIKVSVSADETLYGIDLGISYNPNVLKYQSGADTNSGGTARIARAVNDSSFSYTITFKAIASGSSNVSVSEAIGASTTEFKLSGGSTSVTVKAPVAYSGDSSLKLLLVSPGKLSPSFSSGTKNYSVTVGNETKKLSVSATPMDSKAKVTSVSGNNNLSVGKNTVKVTVTAEDGSKSTYTIIVTREAAKESNTDKNTNKNTNNTGSKNNTTNNNTGNTGSNNNTNTNSNAEQLTPTPEPTLTRKPEEVIEEVTEIEVKLGSEVRYLQKDFGDDDLPESFEKKTVTYQGEEVAAAVSKKGELTMFYLSDLDKKNGAFYVYNENENSFSKFATLDEKGGRYILLTPGSNIEIPDGFEKVTAKPDKLELDVWKKNGVDNNEFYLVYAMNYAGNQGWYLYDTVEETMQRYPSEIIDSDNDAVIEAFGQDSENNRQKRNDLQAKYNKVWSISKVTIVSLAVVSAGLLIVVIYMVYRKKYKNIH